MNGETNRWKCHLQIANTRFRSSKGQDSEGLTPSSSSTDGNTAAAPDGPKGSVVKSAEVKA